MTENEVQLFLWVQKYWDKLFALKKSGALDTCNGSITLHFDAFNNLMQIESKKIEFKRIGVILKT